jgi:CspA family cold shock protein
MSRRKPQDEILFCERCGISFLWPTEEQGWGEEGPRTPPPTRCAGCRYLLPGPDRERGLVKWYNGRKNYGFLTRRNAPEIYVHGSAVENNPRLTVGDLVEFSIGANERGPLAQEVRVLAPAGLHPPDEERLARPTRQRR